MQNYRRKEASLPQYGYKTVSFYSGYNLPTNCTPAAGPASGLTEVTITLTSVLEFDYSKQAMCRWDGKYLTPAKNLRFGTTFKCTSPENKKELMQRVLPAVIPLEIAFNGQNFQAMALDFTIVGGSILNPDDPTGTPILNAIPGELVILSVTPASGLRLADYAVTIRGNNFVGIDKYWVKFGDAYSPRVTKTSPTTLEAYPPTGQSAGEVHVYVSTNDQNWVDACHTKIGETDDHVINVGPCSKFTFDADPICYTCQSPNNPVTLSGVSVAPSSTLLLVVFATLYIVGNPLAP